jgi:hypothetical protein
MGCRPFWDLYTKGGAYSSQYGSPTQRARMVVEGVVEVKFPSQNKTLPMMPLSQKNSNLGNNEKMQNC